MFEANVRKGVKSGMALVVALAGSQFFSGCSAGPLESGEEENVGAASEALVCPGPVPFSAVASSGAISPASNAIDQSTGTRWESAWADNQFIYIDLNIRTNIAGVTLNWEAACGRDYDIEVADQDMVWRKYQEVRGNTRSGPITYEKTAIKVRYVRMTGLTRCTQYGFSLWEFQVHSLPTRCYTDSDRDSEGVSGSFTEVCGTQCAAGRSKNTFDCLDTDARVKSSQTSFFTAHRGDGSFDYNCNDTEDKATVHGPGGCASGAVYPNCTTVSGVRPKVACGANVPMFACAVIQGRCQTVSVAGTAQPCR